jgi:hypothetical protein
MLAIKLNMQYIYHNITAIFYSTKTTKISNLKAQFFRRIQELRTVTVANVHQKSIVCKIVIFIYRYNDSEKKELNRSTLETTS